MEKYLLKLEKELPDIRERLNGGADEYPVRDLKLYANLPKLETIGLAAEGVQGFEALAGSKVKSFKVCGKDSPDAKEKLKKLAEEFKQYAKIHSYEQEYTGTE